MAEAAWRYRLHKLTTIPVVVCMRAHEHTYETCIRIKIIIQRLNRVKKIIFYNKRLNIFSDKWNQR